MTALGRPRAHFRVTGSTNDRARELAAAGAAHGTLVTADLQTAGRGRQGRSWLAPDSRALLLSLVLRDADELLPLRAAVAVAEVCAASATGHDVSIKWPNDVLIGGRKAAGILAEARPQEGWSVLGIGLNVAVDPDDLGPEIVAASLGLDASQREAVLADLLARLDLALALPAGDLLDAWRARDALAGREISWGAGGSGVARGVDGSGRLLVDLTDGSTQALDAGEVHLGAAPTAP